MSNFWQRVFTGAAFLTVMIGSIWYSYFSLAALFLVISVLGLWEFYTLLEKANYHPQKHTALFICVTLNSCLIYLVGQDLFASLLLPYIFWMFIPSALLIFLIELFRNKEQPFHNIGFTILGLLYVQIPFLFLSVLAFRTDMNLISLNELFTPYIVLGFFFLIWANDTFAYLSGRAFGRTKLFERISPKKTWEGAIGGAICTQGMAYLFSMYVTELAPIHWHVMALLVSVLGTMGDLVESMFKRSLGVKDSGNLLPGHGGILDRFDAVLLSAPFVVTYLVLVR
jgi:phosphatidate cytidylyltransferase